MKRGNGANFRIYTFLTPSPHTHTVGMVGKAILQSDNSIVHGSKVSKVPLFG